MIALTRHVSGQTFFENERKTKSKLNKHKKKLIEVEEPPKAYLEELDAQVDRDREVLKKKSFDHDDAQPCGDVVKKMESTTDPESGSQSPKASRTDSITANIGQ